MPLRFESRTVYLEDHCSADEALSLLEYLNRERNVQINLASCAGVHSAILQVIAAARLTDIVPPENPQVGRGIVPFLLSGSEGHPRVTGGGK